MPHRPHHKHDKLTAEEATGLARLEQFRKAHAAERPMAWPGAEPGEFDIVLVPLTDEETDAAYAAAWQTFERLKLQVNLHTADRFEAELALQAIARAMRDPADETRRRPLFSSADALRKVVRPDEKAAIAVAYAELCDSVDPDPRDLTATELAAILAALKKKAATPPSSIGVGTLWLYTRTLADQLESSRSGSSESTPSSPTPAPE